MGHRSEGAGRSPRRGGAMSERRELVAREVFALDADWRREYWDQFRRDFARQAQAYYDTADRILAIVREDAMEVTQHAPADVRERVARECGEEAERLGRWYGDGYAKARSLLREAAALLLTPRGDEEAWRAVLDALGEAGTTAARLRADRARRRVIECARALAARCSDAQGDEADALDLIRWAEAHHAALEPVAGNIMPPGTYACYAGDGGEPYMGPGILGAIRAARRGEE